MTRLTEPKLTYTMDYPAAIEFSDTQMKIYWTADEINVEKDIQDIRVNMSEAESHGVVTTLKLFTLYELVAGRDYWLGRVLKSFPRPDIERMASTFGFFELNVHAPFYNKINEALMLNTDEFYSDYVNDPILKARMEFIGDCVDHKNSLLSLGAFAMVEGAVLYSAFAFLKHFQAKGKNKLLNVVRGINFSVRDENLHCEGGSWLYKTLLAEKLAAGEITQDGVWALKQSLIECAQQITEHECHIVDMIFSKGEIEGITAEQMKTFIKSRVNLCLERLGIGPIFQIANNIVADWFYDNINAVSLHDFFTGVGSSYNRDWKQQEFKW